MEKPNYWKIACVSASIGLFVATLICQYVVLKSLTYSPIQLRELTKIEKYKLHLFEQTNYNLKKYRLLNAVVEKESGWNDKAIGDHGLAYSLCQFHKPTFNEFKEKAGMLELEYKNPIDQLTLLAWAYEHKKMSHWSTWKLVKK